MNFFENRVLENIVPALGANDRAEFFNDSGCLFLECSLATLGKIVLVLSKIGVGAFKVNEVGNDFAIDFI